MKNYLLLFFFLQFFLMANTQPTIQWQKCLGASGTDNATCIKETFDKGFIISGYTNSTDGIATGNHGGNDALIIKLDSIGNIEWSKCLGGSKDDVAKWVEQTNDSGYIVCGYSNSNDGNAIGNHDTTGSRTDGWIFKLDKLGNLVWQRLYGGTADESFNCIAKLQNNQYTVVSVTYSTNGDLQNVMPVLHSYDYGNWFLTIDNNGNIVKQKVEVSKCDFLNYCYYKGFDKIVALSNQNIVYSNFSSYRSGGTGSSQGTSFGIGKIDTNFNYTWGGDLNFLGYQMAEFNRSFSFIKETNKGNILAGSKGFAYPSPIYNGYPWPSSKLIMYDTAGNVLWNKKFFTTRNFAIGYNNYGGNSFASCDASSNEVLLSCSTSDRNCFSCGDSSIPHPINIHDTANGADIFLVVLDSLGNFIWQKALGGSNYENSVASLYTSDDGIINLGNTNSNDGDVSGNHGGYDIWVAKLNLNPIIDIEASDSIICLGTKLSFQSSVYRPGFIPTYEWKINGISVGSNTDTFSSSNLQNNDTVLCIYKCIYKGTPFTTVSNKIIVKAQSSFNPTIAITTYSNNVYCGNMVYFNANTTYGGNNPKYQWYINGSTVGLNSTALNIDTLNNNDTVSCTLLSSLSCGSPTTSNSNKIIMNVNKIKPIFVLGGNASICKNTTQTYKVNKNFTFNLSSVQYKWFVNGIDKGVNTDTYITNSLQNNDEIYCKIYTVSKCFIDSVFETDKWNVAVYTSNPPTVNITTSDTNVCAGSSVQFNVEVSSQPPNSYVDWYVNDVRVAYNSSYITDSLKDGDIVYCSYFYYPSSACGSYNIKSNKITIHVVNPINSSISISATQDTACKGTLITFTASTINQGINATYNWYLNGTNVGANQKTYSSATLNNNANIYCVLKTNSVCAVNQQLNSNHIIVTIMDTARIEISISTVNSKICRNTDANFTATVVNEGMLPKYHWYINNSISLSDSLKTFRTNNLNNNDTISCEIISNNNCIVDRKVLSNKIIMNVYDTLIPAIFIHSKDTVINMGATALFSSSVFNGGLYPQYNWYINNNSFVNNSANFLATNLVNNDTIYATLNSDLICAAPQKVVSNKVIVQVLNSSKQIQLYPNPATNNVTINCSNAKQLQIIDVKGRLIKLINNPSDYQIINTKQFSKGTYIIQVVTISNEIINKKLIID